VISEVSKEGLSELSPMFVVVSSSVVGSRVSNTVSRGVESMLSLAQDSSADAG
jgi:hypothetical protein